MNKYYLLALLLLGAVTLVGCSQTQEEVIVESVDTIVVEELILEVPEVIVESVVDCYGINIPAYNGKLDVKQYPSIDLAEYNTVEITAKFSDHFVNNYRYEDSDQFYFAMKIFLGDYADRGGYYNVLRTRSLSVANWNYLTGAIFANALKDGFTWTIPLHDDIYLANSEFVEGLQFTKEVLSKDIDGETRIGAYLSSVKELKGWELGDISMNFCK